MRVNYKHPTKMSRKKNRAINQQKEKKEPDDSKNEEMIDDTQQKLESHGLSKAKRKELFKKEKARDIKQQIADLKL